MKQGRIVAIVALVIAATAAVACGSRRSAHEARSPDKMKEHVAHRLERVLDEIDATSAQRAKVNQVKGKLFAEFDKAHAGSRSTREQALGEWRAAKPDAARLHELVDRRSAAYNEAMHAMVDGLMEVHAVLDSKQRDEIAGMMQERLGN